MFSWLFGKKKSGEDYEKHREEVKSGFGSVKKDINNVSQWVKYLNDGQSKQDFEIMSIKSELSSLKDEIENLKNVFEMMDTGVLKQVFKTGKQQTGKQTAVYGVQTGVQTAVQTGGFPSFSNFSVVERALIWVLLNTDLKLSYDDLSAVLGKSRATIRGQINAIKQKGEGLIEEIIESNGKKRIYIPDEIREKMLKRAKVRVKQGKKAKKSEENEIFEE